MKDINVNKLASFYKVFGDKTRLRIIIELSKSEICVSELTELLGMEQSAISHQLKILKQENIVKYRREGKCIYYSLDDNHVHNIIEQGIEHISHVGESDE